MSNKANHRARCEGDVAKGEGERRGFALTFCGLLLGESPILKNGIPSKKLSNVQGAC